jgi:hypothetical protein
MFQVNDQRSRSKINLSHALKKIRIEFLKSVDYFQIRKVDEIISFNYYYS